ncbi:hypothetical protein CHS0354_023213 [Potamilus streckersoni]|uniref:Uncharacterized protein n=1 Tax=Potamilus streckersoni TaxID=2493646 RepID=A0AAE0SKD3_9BIVA|nr:hypothetical protein CHS0354_023213 [Potamilus streckersoni]
MVEEDGEIEHPAFSHQIHQEKDPVEQSPCEGHQEKEDDVENHPMEEVSQLSPYALDHHADEVGQQAPPFCCQEQKAADKFSVPSHGDQEEEAEVEHQALSSWHHKVAEVEQLPPSCVGHLEDKVDQPGTSCFDPQVEEEVKQLNPSFTDHQIEKKEVHII